MLLLDMSIRNNLESSKEWLSVKNNFDTGRGMKKVKLRNTRRQSKSQLDKSHKDNLTYLKAPRLGSKNRMLFRTYSFNKFSESDKPKNTLDQESICLKKRFHLKKLIGRGKQGVVYLAIDSKTNRKVALKIVTDDYDEKKRFEQEVIILKDIQKLDEELWFPKIISIELKSRFYLIWELLGDSLMDVQNKYNSVWGFSLKTVLLIGMHLLERLKTFHMMGYVHGDIKPANIMFGKGPKKNILFLIDYGLSKKESAYNKPSAPSFMYNRSNLQLNGTPLFASVNSHLGWTKMFKKDDIESMLYMLINLHKDSSGLPWFKLPIIHGDNYHNILQAKMNVKTSELWKDLPSAFAEIFDYTKGLANNEEIDYELIEDLFFKWAHQKDIDIKRDLSTHKFQWLLESKRNTDGVFYKENRNHLKSWDSILLKSNSDDFIDFTSFKSSKNNPQEEEKHMKSPEVEKKGCSKKKKKIARTTKPKGIRIKDYQGQAASFISKNIAKLSPASSMSNGLLHHDLQNKLSKMLKVNANNISESLNSEVSSPSKMQSNRKLNLSQVKFTTANNTNGKKPNARNFYPSGNDDKYFPEFDKSSIIELPADVVMQTPLLFNTKEMNLKEVSRKSWNSINS